MGKDSDDAVSGAGVELWRALLRTDLVDVAEMAVEHVRDGNQGLEADALDATIPVWDRVCCGALALLGAAAPVWGRT